MAIVRYLKQTVASGYGPRELFECRYCGTSVGARGDDCPACGSSEVAHYELE